MLMVEREIQSEVVSYEEGALVDPSEEAPV